MAMPGMQNPHCTPPHATKLSAIFLRSSSGRPSRVSTSLPATCCGFIVQLRRGLPSTISVQHPHDACGSQPFLSDRHWKSSRKTLSSERSSGFTLTDFPLSVKETSPGGACLLYTSDAADERSSVD